MTNRQTLMFARILAAVGLLFWICYILKYVLGAPLFLNSEERNQIAVQLGFGAYGYIVLLIGVFLGAVYQEIKAGKASGNNQIKIGKMIKRALGSADFWLGVFASPVVYAVLLQAINITNVTISGLFGLTLVGLQNGFVCNTIADSIINNRLPVQAQPKP